MFALFIRRTLGATALAALAAAAAAAPGAAQGTVAFVGATLIDGTGAPPVPNATVVVQGDRITAVGPRSSVSVPSGARTIDASGQFLLPGFIDSNVHISLYGAGETFVRYEHDNARLVREAAQLHLKYGITTVRDSYGSLLPLVQVREEIERGETIGPRILAAGNIVGWGGPYSVTFSLRDQDDLTLWQEQINDFITQGSGEELMAMTPDELRVAINAYLDKGPDFIKYGGTGHFSDPYMIGFSPRTQRVLVEEANKRGLVAETHSTSREGLLMSVEAGIDLIQHPEALDDTITDELVRAIIERDVICGPLTNSITGDAWKRYQERQARGEDEAEEEVEERNRRELTTREQRAERSGEGLARRRFNAEKLIRSGCITVPTTDNYLGSAPEFRREPKAATGEAGIGSIIAIEGLVELGMTPMEAIVAATRNGAIASRGLDEFGTVEVGKVADLILLDADPLADISNIREVSTVMRAGRLVDLDALPTDPVWYGKGMSLAPDDR